MTRSRDIADQQDNLGGAVAPFVAGKNFIINGGFDIFQRSTFTSQTASAYALDRWYVGVGGTVTITQQTTGAPVGSQYCMRVAYNAASSFGNQFQALESANATALAGQTVTATVLVRANASWAATTSQGLNFYVEKNSTANTLTGGTWSSISSTVVTGASISTGTSSTSWTKLTVTCAIPNDGTAAGLRLRIGESVVGPSGAYWEMAQCQLEVGSAATPFARAGGSIGGELALCQRYYHRFNFNSGSYSRAGFGTASTTTNGKIFIPFNTTMRATPTAVDYSTLGLFDGVNTYTITSVALDQLGPENGTVDCAVASGLTQYRPYFLYYGNTTGAYIGFSAEL
jgi:hypothetical protein